MIKRLERGSGAKRAGGGTLPLGVERREGSHGICLDGGRTWDRVSVGHAVAGPTMGTGVIVSSRVVGEFQVGWGWGHEPGIGL